MGIYVTCPNIWEIEFEGYGPYYKSCTEEKTTKKERCSLCGEISNYQICEDCVNESILDDEIRLDYINSDQELISDWKDYTDNLILSGYEPTKEELEVVKNEHEENKWSLCATIKWIKEDIRHFREWFLERAKTLIEIDKQSATV